MDLTTTCRLSSTDIWLQGFVDPSVAGTLQTEHETFHAPRELQPVSLKSHLLLQYHLEKTGASWQLRPQQLQTTDAICPGCVFVPLNFITHHDFATLHLFHPGPPVFPSSEGDSYSSLSSRGSRKVWRTKHKATLWVLQGLVPSPT